MCRMRTLGHRRDHQIDPVLMPGPLPAHGGPGTVPNQTGDPR